jgi:hypothetical protein
MYQQTPAVDKIGGTPTVFAPSEKILNPKHNTKQRQRFITQKKIT